MSNKTHDAPCVIKSTELHNVQSTFILKFIQFVGNVLVSNLHQTTNVMKGNQVILQKNTAFNNLRREITKKEENINMDI